MTTKTILITRPEPDATRTAKEFKAHGIESVICPLIEIEYKDIILDSEYQGVIVASANAIRALEHVEINKALPIYTVGNHTAQEAKACGWQQVHSAQGNSQDLTKMICRHATKETQPLLYARADYITGTLYEDVKQAGFQIEQQIAYNAKAIKILPQDVMEQLEKGVITGITFYSLRTAQIWLDVVKHYDKQHITEKLTAYCLSEKIASNIGTVNWKEIRVAQEYNMINIVG